MASQQLVMYIFAFLGGLCVGSFLNVLALRSLSGQSIYFPASHCFKCEHKLAPWQNIPLISYLILGGKCHYCRGSISWQYPAVEFATGLTFVLLAHVFILSPLPLDNAQFEQGANLYASIHSGLEQHIFASDDIYGFPRIGLILGMVALACTLIAVTVTDFREKLIPHEITYPSMIVGLIFSAVVRRDLLGAMAGVGASYIIFDFLAFYGLKLYLAAHGGDEEELDGEAVDDQLDRNLDVRVMDESEPLEVMGGGDAVLSAVIAAYLGWQMLVVSLAVGFLAGTVMGLALLFVEMKKANLLVDAFKRSLIWAAVAGLVCGLIFLLLPLLLSQGAFNEQVVYMSLSTAGIAGLAFALLGMISVGTRVSKPFPFGPALALGGFIAIFLIPYWLPFN